MMKKGRDHGFFVTYNHPSWSLENYNDYTNYNYMNAMEICNYSASNAGFEDYVPTIYDDMLRAGKRIYCIGADDNHNYGDPNSPYYDAFGAFTVIKAEKLEYRTITKALEAGHFYASQGPEIKELWYEDGEIHIKCSPAERIVFNCGTRHTKSVIAENGRLVDYASFKIPETAIYVRATVTDTKGKHANTNAYFIDELNDQ